MPRCLTILLACVALLGGGRLAGQTQATARLSFRIPAVLHLETVATGGTALARPSYTEVRSAVVLRVDANCAWRLVPAEDGRAGAAVEVRALVAGSQGAAFQPLTAGVPIAAGERGRNIAIVLDYRLPAGAASPPVRYVLELAGE